MNLTLKLTEQLGTLARTASEPKSIEEKITAKLNGLGIKSFQVKEKTVGPLVTSYPISVGHSVPIKKILDKAEDMALACGVDSVDIQRVRDEIIVFVPNKDRTIVDFKDALHWFLNDQEVRAMNLPILIGMDFIGHKSALDLSTQPHILIAGSTGAGKSVFESNIIASLTTIKSPESLHVFLVDTKRVDLGLFEKLPHIKQIARDENEWYSLINSLYEEVQQRQRIFEKHEVRNIQEYNALEITKMPYQVLIIDEFADLVEKDKDARRGIKPKDYPEPSPMNSLKKLTQICRASGTHVICCTQRTSVESVAGTIKANFPTRISLRLPTATDSRTILGVGGAEKLLGNGDMLISTSESDSINRFHGPFVRLDDIKVILEQQDMIRSGLGL